MERQATAVELVAVDDAGVRAEAKSITDAFLPREAVARLAAQRSDARGLLQAFTQLALIALFTAVWSGWLPSVSNGPDGGDRVAVRVVALFMQAFTMAFLFNGLHECVHFSAFRTRQLNELFATVFGLLTTRPPLHYTYYHYNHHKFTGDPKRDPELQDSFIDMRLDRPLSYLFYLSGVPFWIDRSTTLLRHALFRWVLPREKLFLTVLTERRMIQEARLFVGVYCLLTLAALSPVSPPNVSSFIIWNWFVPTLLAQPFLRFYLIAEHTGCTQGADMLSNTRTTETFAWYRWLAWQMPYHAEHHAYPNVPFHKLHELHDALARQRATQGHRNCVPNGESGYLGVHVTLWKAWLSGRPVQREQ